MKITRFVLSFFILLSLMMIVFPFTPWASQAADGTFYYDFIAHASEASWSSGDGSLSFPGGTDDSRGFACYRDGIKLEDGVTYGRVLETHPNWDAYGHIQGTYPEMTIMSGTELVIWVGFLDGAAGTDGVHFQVNFRFWNGDTYVTTAVASLTAYYDGHLNFERVSLNSYAGKTGRFTIYAGAGPSSGKDWAVWAQAEIRPVDGPVLILTECPLSDAIRGEAYSVRLEAIGGEVPPYHWAIIDGSLPPGLNLNSDTGTISGTPTGTGTYSFRLRVCDSTELDGARCSEPKDCYIQVNEPGETPPPPQSFDFSLSVSPAEITVNLDPLVSGATCTVEAQTTATISLVSGIAQTVDLSLSGVPTHVSSYCLPCDGLPPFTSECGFIVYCTGSLPAEGDYTVTLTATGGGITRTKTITLHIVRGVYGDLDIISVGPVQVVYGAPLIAGKATAFRVKLHSDFHVPIETHLRLMLPDDEWNTTPPLLPRGVHLPSDWEYPEFWGPVTINPGDSEIMLPIVPAGMEDAPFDPALNPAGILEIGCPCIPYGTCCYPNLRVAPMPRDVSMVTYTVEVDPYDAISETSEHNNEYYSGAAVCVTKPFRVLFVIHISNESENDLLYCRNFNCIDCCSSPHVDVTCAGGSRTHSEMCEEIREWAKAASEYLLGVLPIADSKFAYRVDCTVREEDNYSDYMGSMIALARENGYDYVLSVQPWGYCGCCGIGSAGGYVEVYGSPSQAAHELAGHGIQRVGYECYAPSPDACPNIACPDCWCTEVSSSSCAASEGFWVNEWHSYSEGSWSSPWIVQPPTYYMDSGGSTPPWDRWQRLDNPLRHSDGRELPGGYLDLIEILEDADDPEVLLTRGMIDKDGTATLGPCMILENAIVDIEAGEEGDYYLVLIDSEETVLSKTGFDVSFDFMTAEGKEELDKVSFVYRIEWLELAKKIELQDKDGSILASVAVSPNEPEVQVLYPNGGESFVTGENITAGWQGSDEDGDALTYSLAISLDNGEIWLPIDIDVTDNEYEMSTEALEEGQNYLIKVRATDGVNTAEDISDGTFNITAEGEVEEGGINTRVIIVIVIVAIAVIGVAVYLGTRRKKA